MPSKSKTKGNNWELDLCKILSTIFGGSFTRVPNSGAFTGGKHFSRRASLSETQNKIYKGDIITPDHMPKLMVEAKSYADFRFHQLIIPGELKQLDVWIDQVNQASDPGDVSLICFKINRRGSFIAVPEWIAKNCTFTNHSRYISPFGNHYLTEMVSFLNENKDVVMKLSSK